MCRTDTSNEGKKWRMVLFQGAQRYSKKIPWKVKSGEWCFFKGSHEYICEEGVTFFVTLFCYILQSRDRSPTGTEGRVLMSFQPLQSRSMFRPTEKTHE